jgi:hypothetical protein
MCRERNWPLQPVSGLVYDIPFYLTVILSHSDWAFDRDRNYQRQKSRVEH